MELAISVKKFVYILEKALLHDESRAWFHV